MIKSENRGFMNPIYTAERVRIAHQSDRRLGEDGSLWPSAPEVRGEVGRWAGPMQKGRSLLEEPRLTVSPELEQLQRQTEAPD